MMAWLAHFLYGWGTESLHIFWVPLVCWTAMAALIIGGLHLFESRIPPVVHYYSRVTLLWGLFLGVAGSLLFHYLPLSSTAKGASAVKFIIISSSVITPATSGAALHWSNPLIWLGAFTLVALGAAAMGSIKLMIQWMTLAVFTSRLPAASTIGDLSLSDANRRMLDQLKSVSLHFSRYVEVPCTFGWFHKRIILPQHLRVQKQKLDMALRHELVHIANGDYLLNGGIEIIKALFYVHPLVHRLAARIREYREVYCDQHVLQNGMFPRKIYAQFVFELSHKAVFKPATAVNMAVQPSTLKKRIQAMKSSTPILPPFKWSLSIMLAATLLITGIVACSDVTDDGITRSDIQRTQAKTYDIPTAQNPLYLVNGKKGSSKILSRLKTKYIKSINVLKGKKAVKTYGSEAKNGAIDITLNVSRSTAFSDLKDRSKVQMLTNINVEPKIYIKAQKMPALVGGQQAINEHISYPKECKQAGAEGRVIIQFVVTKEGTVTNPNVVRGIGHGCDKAAIQALKQSKWKPGEQNGQPVNVQFNWVVTFKLPKS